MKGITAAQAAEITKTHGRSDDLLTRIEESIAKEAAKGNTEMSWNMGTLSEYTDIIHTMQFERGFKLLLGMGMFFPYFTVSWDGAHEEKKPDKKPKATEYAESDLDFRL